MFTKADFPSLDDIVPGVQGVVVDASSGEARHHLLTVDDPQSRMPASPNSHCYIVGSKALR